MISAYPILSTSIVSARAACANRANPPVPICIRRRERAIRHRWAATPCGTRRIPLSRLIRTRTDSSDGLAKVQELLVLGSFRSLVIQASGSTGERTEKEARSMTPAGLLSPAIRSPLSPHEGSTNGSSSSGSSSSGSCGEEGSLVALGWPGQPLLASTEKGDSPQQLPPPSRRRRSPTAAPQHLSPTRLPRAHSADASRS